MGSVVDVVIVGQGLAGTALAWQLHWSGLSIVVIDREAEVTSSKVAAGLVTPITGQKLVWAWNLEKFWPAAVEFYRRVEQETGSNLFHVGPMVRLFVSADEVGVFESRRAAGEYSDLTVSSPVRLESDSFAVAHGGFEMAPAGRLDCPAYLHCSREAFRARGEYIACELDVPREIELKEGQVEIPRLGIRATWVVFCQGYTEVANRWFGDVRFKPARGEILGLRVPDLRESRVVHQGVWLAPQGDGIFKAGATYDWNDLAAGPTDEGQREIVVRLREFLRRPFEVVSHHSAVRPIHRNQYPVVGTHPHHSQLAIFNGLGSKGTLQAPWCARQLVDHLLHGSPVDAELDVNRKTIWRSLAGSPDSPNNANSTFHVKRQTHRPLTEQAQEAVRRVVGIGEVAIDATAGNGHDTQFLAEMVGPTGRVFAFDIQPEAITRTTQRLSDHNHTNVTLLLRNHDDLSAAIPLDDQQRVAAVMFNLGYLPGGDKRVITDQASTRTAIEQAAAQLRPGGILTIVCYTGHDGGAAEAESVRDTLNQLPPSRFQLNIIESQPGRTLGPRLFVVKRVG